MYSACREAVTPTCSNDLMDAIIDLFATDARIVEDQKTEFVILIEISVNICFTVGYSGLSGIFVFDSIRKDGENGND